MTLIVLVATGEYLDGGYRLPGGYIRGRWSSRARQQDVVTFVDDGCEYQVDGLLAAVGDDDLGGSISHRSRAGSFRQLPSSVRETGCGGVAEVLRVVERFACGIHNVRGGGEVRFACTETNDRASLSLECFCLCVDGKGGGGCDGTDAA